MTETNPYRSCPSCENSQATDIAAYSPDTWTVASCDGCGFVYLRNPPAYEDLVEDFAWEKTYVAKKSASKGSTVFSPLARKVKEKTKLFMRNRDAKMRKWFHDGRVLDIGCGTGTRIPEPMTPFGIELSKAMHAQADANMRARGGYCLKGAGAEAIWDFPEAHFDGIIMNSYLEHEAEPFKVLSGAKRALKETGKIFLRVPNYASLNRHVIGSKWCGFRYPDHVNYFTLSSLRTLCAKAGFSVKLTNLTLPIDDNINALLTPRLLTEGAT